MTFRLRIFLLLLLTLSATTAETQEPNWQQVIRRRYPDTACAVLPMAHGAVAVAGTSTSMGGFRSDGFLTVFDSRGRRLWTRVYNHGEVDKLHGAARDTDGNFYLSGTTWLQGQTTAKGLLIRTDARGKKIWQIAMDSTVSESANAVCTVPAGGVVVAGFQDRGSAQGKDIILSRVDAFGQVLWSERYDGPGDDIPWSVLQTSDDGIVAAGEKGVVAGDSGAAFLLKTDAHGWLQWLRTFHVGDASVVRCVIACREGGYALVGSTWRRREGFDILVIRTDTNGNVLWTRSLGNQYSDHGRCIRQASDGGFMIAGNAWTRGHQGSSDMLLMKIDRHGRVLWKRHFGGSSFDAGYSLTEVPGGWVVAGKTRSFGADDGDVLVVRVDDNGAGP